MKSRQVDPRQAESEVPDPRYWVIFWDEAGASDEWELVDCEVDEALRWAEDRTGGRTYGLWAVFNEGVRVATVRLKGADPNDNG